MGDTYVTDMRHLPEPRASDDVPAPARRLAEFLGRIVAEVVATPSIDLRPTTVPCLRRPRGRPCSGPVVARLAPGDEVEWSCAGCSDRGVIRNWRGSDWDPSRGAKIIDLATARRPTPGPPQTNAYCERLGIAVPRLEELVGKADSNLFRLMAAAILERGAPMTLDELVTRLDAAGAVAASGDLALSLKKAWKGKDPIYKDPQGRYGVNLDSAELALILIFLRLRGPGATEAAKKNDEPPRREDGEPLTEEELAALFQSRSLRDFSSARQAAAVLDVKGPSLSLEELAHRVAALGGTKKLSPPDWTKGGLLAVGADGRVSIDRASAAARAMRQAVRKLALPVLRERAREAKWKAARTEHTARRAVESERERQDAATVRRAILRVVPEPGAPAAAALLDLGDRSIRTFLGPELSSLPDALLRYDLIVGLDVRETLAGLGLDTERWRVVDLNPPKKTTRLNKQGRTLKITRELLITSTTGITKPLGDASKVAGYLAEGDHGKLARRLASDLKSLHAFYRFAVLHRAVRLRWGFLDEVIAAGWGLPGDATLYGTLEEAKATGRAIEVVTGSAPGWEEPWARAERFESGELDFWSVRLRRGGEVVEVPRYDVQAIRLADERSSNPG